MREEDENYEREKWGKGKKKRVETKVEVEIKEKRDDREDGILVGMQCRIKKKRMRRDKRNQGCKKEKRSKKTWRDRAESYKSRR